MLTEIQIKNEAARLNKAELDRQQVAATTTFYPDMDIADAYKIQSAWMDIKKSSGRTVSGYKIGLTSRVMQKVMGIDEPDYGMLLDDMVFENNSEIDAQAFLDPKIEVELAFFLKEKLFGDNVTIEDVMNATDHVMPALELIAARTYRVHPDTGYKRNVRDTISDNAANAGVIVGGTPIKPKEIDLRWIGAMMMRNDIIEESGVSGAVLNHPANGVAWLAKKYTAHGIALQPGQIILAGSFTRPVEVRSGDTFNVDFHNMGSIVVHFK